MALTLSALAAHKVKEHLAQRGHGLGIRMIVNTSECNGMSYHLEFVDQAQGEDLVFESHGTRIYTDPRSLAYLDGTEIDFGTEGDDTGFVLNNPNVKSECACGESFYI